MSKGEKIMPTLTVSIPKKLKDKMDEHPEINWSEVIKNRLEKRAEAILEFEKKRKKEEK
jgi:hypothetical protein